MSTQELPMEHRWGERMDCQALAHICMGDEHCGVGRVLNVSSSGAYIETALDLPEGSQMTLIVLGNESAKRAVEIRAVVVRRQRDGMGVEWCETPEGCICARIGCKTRCAAEGESACAPFAESCSQ